MGLSKKEMDVLNSKIGIRGLLGDPKVNTKKALKYVEYETQLGRLQEELLKLQKWVVSEGKKIVVLFEGRDAAGKGGAIRRIVEHLNPREYRVVALPKPDEIERGQWYFQRYVNQLPKSGEIVFFDRSWYNRAIVEPVNGFCTGTEYTRFMAQVNEFERMMVESNIHLIKFYFSISKEEQEKRFQDIIGHPLKKWKYSAVDANALALWDEYTKYKEKMFEQTNKYVPWRIIRADKKMKARIAAARHLLQELPYEGKNDKILRNKN